MNLTKYKYLLENPQLTEFYITDDGHVFLPSAKSYLLSYCRTKGISYKKYTKADLEKAVKEKKAEERTEKVKDLTKEKTKTTKK